MPPGRCGTSVAHVHTAYFMGVRPPGFVFAFASLYQQELFNVTSNAMFCVLQVWQDFIRIVVQCLLSHGTNFFTAENKSEIIHKMVVVIKESE